MVSLVIRDYEEAIQFYTEKLDFELIEDTQLSEKKRWVTVSPKNSNGFLLLLAKAANKRQRQAIGNQAGGRVFLFLYTDDFWKDYERMKDKGVEFTRLPKEESYGTIAVFKDLYDNLWDLIQPT